MSVSTTNIPAQGGGEAELEVPPGHVKLTVDGIEVVWRQDPEPDSHGDGLHQPAEPGLLDP